jgi:transposase InsO family protein
VSSTVSAEARAAGRISEVERSIARRLGLKQTVTPKRSPRYNPFAEALLGAFKEECVYQSDWKSYEEAAPSIEAWFHKYRHRREQNALGGLAPLEYRVRLLRELAA